MHSQVAKEVLALESKEIAKAISGIGDNFNDAVDKILSISGKIIVTGIGKSGLIGAKIASTLSSMGTSSFFIHPTEAMHGDLGMINKDDLVLAISYSGENEELINILPHLKKMQVPIIALTSKPNNHLARNSDIFLSIFVEQEACSFNIAPTSSTTLTLVLGDALAIALMKARGFKKDDFASLHPAGQIGKRLLTKAKDFFTTEELPIVKDNTSVKESLIVMTSARLGTLIIVDKDNNFIGIFSDGDFRRAVMNEDFSMSDDIIRYATSTPKTFSDENMLAIDALKIIEQYNIQVLVCVKNKTVKGLIHIHELVKARL